MGLRARWRRRRGAGAGGDGAVSGGGGGGGGGGDGGGGGGDGGGGGGGGGGGYGATAVWREMLGDAALLALAAASAAFVATNAAADTRRWLGVGTGLARWERPIR